MSRESIVHIPENQSRMRRVLGKVLAPVLRSEVRTEGDGLDRAKEAALNGSGLVVLWNHFNKRNGFDIARVIIGTDELVDRPSVFPLAKHQESKILDYLEKHAGFQYPKIVTDDTLEKPGYENETLGNGMADYAKRSREALSHGGTVSVAFQGGRRDHLDIDDDKTTVGTFIGSMQHAKVTDFGILLVGLGEKRKPNYAASGLRLFKQAQINIGPYFSLDELMAHPDVDGKLRQVDPFIRRQFVDLVPPEYLTTPKKKST